MGWTAYALSLGIGLGVGLAYGVLGVRSPAPPVIALLGLLGMLIGETLVSYLRDRTNAAQAVTACLHGKRFDETAATDARRDPSAPPEGRA